MAIEKFTGGKDSVRTKLNQLVDAVNSLLSLSGDEFIRVQRTALGGVSLSLSINSILPRIPKLRPTAVSLTATFAMISSKTGAEPPYVYTAVEATMDEDGVWSADSGAVEYENIYNMEEQGDGGQWVNPLLMDDVVLLYAAPGGAAAYVAIRSHYRGTH